MELLNSLNSDKDNKTKQREAFEIKNITLLLKKWI